MNVTIEFCVPKDPYKGVCHTTLVRHFHSVAFFDLTFAKYKAYTYMVHSSFPVRHFSKIALAAIVCPVSVTDSAESDDFDLWPDLDLTGEHLKKFKIPFKSS